MGLPPRAGAKPKNKSERSHLSQGKNLKLPSLKNNNQSAYLQHPGEGLNKSKIKAKPLVNQVIRSYPVKMCGLCGSKHAPGEPHKA